MPCHSPTTTVSRRRRRLLLSRKTSPPKIAAVFNLTDRIECQARETIERFHTGEAPTFRCHGMHRAGNVLLEVAEWFPARTDSRPPVYSLVTWSWKLTMIKLSWHDYATLDAALEAFRVAVRGSADTDGTADCS